MPNLRYLAATSLAIALALQPALAQDNREPAEPAPKLERRLTQPAEDANARVFTLDRIVAVVNEDVITQLELNHRMNVVIGQLRKQGTELPDRRALTRQVLDRMITDQVQFQLAKETGLRIDDTQLDRALQRIAEDNKMSLGDFRAALEGDGVPFKAFRDDIRSEMLLARLREREVDNKVVVTDAEIETELQAGSQRADPDEELLVSHILVQIPDQASAEQIEARRQRAEQALAKVKGGMDFAQASASFSDATEALQGGSLGWRTPARLPKLFVDALVGLGNGQVSPVLKSANGFHIVKLVDKRGKDAKQVIEQTKARHILIKVTQITTETDAELRARQLKERLDNGEDFATLAKQFSEDASAPSGGDLGWVSPGDTVPEFERTMNALDTGKISDPVRSPFGWHVVQVLERRSQDVTQERGRLLARQGLRQRKADEAFQDWIRQLRDRAYIEYRLEDK